MADLSKSDAASRSCQLSSLLKAISCYSDDMESVERGNLMDLASRLSEEISVYLLEDANAVEVNRG